MNEEYGIISELHLCERGLHYQYIAVGLEINYIIRDIIEIRWHSNPNKSGTVHVWHAINPQGRTVAKGKSADDVFKKAEAPYVKQLMAKL